MLVFVRVLALGTVLLTAMAGAVAALELLMVERANCPYCKRWDAEIGPQYGRTEEGRLAPLRRVNIRDLPRDVAFETPVTVTPTFVLLENGKEIGRVTGYTDDFTFWGLLKDQMKR